MKISIITVCYNSAQYLQDAIDSVASQDYDNIEYLIVDGGSTDDTIDIIQRNQQHVANWISEPDKGIYDAMNKGIKMATGEVIGILNSDDLYAASDIISKVATAFSPETDAVFGDIFFVNPEDMEKTVRTYSASSWHPRKFAWGFMPPHPSFFVRAQYYHQYGLYKTDYKIAADYELLIRFLAVHHLKYKYLPLKMVKMRTGGVSTQNLKSNVILNKEIYRACKENHLSTNYLKIYSKYFRKVFELI